MGPSRVSHPSYLFFFQSRCTAEVRALRWGVAQRETRFRTAVRPWRLQKLSGGVYHFYGCS
jgi:hypothetical protein